ncbi:MAG: hypothetical protein GY861_19420 [bacterium]|nr:hypothetical protein [bacterium]
MTSLTIVLIAGTLLSIVAKKISLPDTLLLLLGGMVLSYISYEGNPVLSFPTSFLIGISTIALLMIVLDSSSVLKLDEVNKFSTGVLKLAMIFLFLNIVVMTLLTHQLFSMGNLYLSLIFAVLVAGTAPDVVLSQLKGICYNAVEILKLESIINTPLTVLLPFIFVQLIHDNVAVVSAFMNEIGPFLQQFVTGVGTGVVVGIIIFKIMWKQYSDVYSPLGLVVAGMLTYILAENLGGNGVLAVAVFGLVFANSPIKRKNIVMHFESELTVFMKIMVFTLIGIYIALPLTLDFFLKSLLLFVVYMLIRFVAVHIAFRKSKYTIKEQIFMTLNTPKGIAVAVVVFYFMAFTDPSSELFIPGIEMVMNLTMAFMLYSIITSSIAVKFTKQLLAAPKNIKKNI